MNHRARAHLGAARLVLAAIIGLLGASCTGVIPADPLDGGDSVNPSRPDAKAPGGDVGPNDDAARTVDYDASSNAADGATGALETDSGARSVDSGARSVDSGARSVDSGSPDIDAASSDPFEEARQVCLQTINDYRATLNLPPLMRASAAQEACSDRGAAEDAARNQAHYSAGMCGGLGAQNTCPGWGIRNGQTLGDTLRGCLAQMWAEGEPQQGTQACLDEYFAGNAACFLAHGHYINMASSSAGRVACGFYRMPDGKMWMNQDFGR